MNIAILGAGVIATSMATAINGLDDSYCAYAVASRNLDKAEAFKEKWGFKVAYGSYEEMLKDPAVDLVYVATPHSHHFEHTKLCIEYGKPALVEKAFTANSKQAKELIALAEEKKVFITEAIWTRYMPSRKIIDDVIKSGLIGDVHLVIAELSYPINGVERLVEPSLAGGALLDLGVYPINFASMVLGDEVTDILGKCTLTDTGVDSQESMTLTYKNGQMAILSASMKVAAHRFGLIRGTKGYINCTNINNVEAVEVYDENHNLLKNIEIPTQINGYEYEVMACKRALEAGELECEEMPHSETIRIMDIMDNLRDQFGVKYPFE